MTNMPLENCSAECKVNKSTAVDWASFCREVLEHAFLNEEEKLGGVGKIVEIDESKFGKRKYHRGHAVEGQWVFGGIQRDNGRCFLVPVETRDAATLLDVLLNIHFLIFLFTFI